MLKRLLGCDSQRGVFRLLRKPAPRFPESGFSSLGGVQGAAERCGRNNAKTRVADFQRVKATAPASLKRSRTRIEFKAENAKPGFSMIFDALNAGGADGSAVSLAMRYSTGCKRSAKEIIK